MAPAESDHPATPTSASCPAPCPDPDVLLPDEPASHLDLAAIEWLEQRLTRFTGPFVVISHDRTFLDRTVTQRRGRDGSGSVDVVADGYADWDAKRKPRPEAEKPAAVDEPKAAKLSYTDQRDCDLLPERIEKIEGAIARHGARAQMDPH